MCTKEIEDRILPHRYCHGVNWTKVQYESRKIHHHQTKISFWFKRIKIKGVVIHKNKRMRQRAPAGFKARSQVWKEVETGARQIESQSLLLQTTLRRQPEVK